MLALVLGALVLFLLLGGMRAFERASIGTITALLAWIALLGGLSLALLLVLTGRTGAAISAVLLVGPLVWQKVQATLMRSSASARPAAGAGRPGKRPASMSRQDAYAVLGLPAGAPDAAIREAHRRLMQRAHPDVGGSDWLAARINQARDVLLG